MLVQSVGIVVPSVSGGAAKRLLVCCSANLTREMGSFIPLCVIVWLPMRACGHFWIAGICGREEGGWADVGDTCVTRSISLCPKKGCGSGSRDGNGQHCTGVGELLVAGAEPAAPEAHPLRWCVETPQRVAGSGEPVGMRVLVAGEGGSACEG